MYTRKFVISVSCKSRFPHIYTYMEMFADQGKTNFRFPFPFAANKGRLPFFSTVQYMYVCMYIYTENGTLCVYMYINCVPFSVSSAYTDGNGTKQKQYNTDIYIYIYIYCYPFLYIYIYGKRTNGKQQLLFDCCKRNTESANFRLFAANGNRKR